MGEPKSDWGKELKEDLRKLDEKVNDMNANLSNLRGRLDTIGLILAGMLTGVIALLIAGMTQLSSLSRAVGRVEAFISQPKVEAPPAQSNAHPTKSVPDANRVAEIIKRRNDSIDEKLYVAALFINVPLLHHPDDDAEVQGQAFLVFGGNRVVVFDNVQFRTGRDFYYYASINERIGKNDLPEDMVFGVKPGGIRPVFIGLVRELKVSEDAAVQIVKDMLHVLNHRVEPIKILPTRFSMRDAMALGSKRYQWHDPGQR